VVDAEFLGQAAEAAPHPWLEQTDIPVVVALGRLVPVKDHGTLLRAFGILRQRRPVRLILFGEGPERPRLERLIEDLRLSADVALPGFCSRPAAALSRAAAYVLSSRVESLSNTLIEALACGVPAVATDCPCGPREVLEGGRYGSLVSCGSPEQLAAAVHRTLDETPARERLKNRARDFSLDRIMPHYLDLIGRAASGGQRDGQHRRAA
jgi:glycosyltransferase involved in cell wall biosynthesis